MIEDLEITHFIKAHPLGSNKRLKTLLFCLKAMKTLKVHYHGRVYFYTAKFNRK